VMVRLSEKDDLETDFYLIVSFITPFVL